MIWKVIKIVWNFFVEQIGRTKKKSLYTIENKKKSLIQFKLNKISLDMQVKTNSDLILFQGFFNIPWSIQNNFVNQHVNFFFF